MTSIEREKRIWDALRAAGMTEAGTAGVMGNLYAESALNPTNLQNTYEKSLGYSDDAYTAAVDSGAYKNFVRDSAGYGLAQWTYWTRKQALLDHCKAAGRSIGDLDAQLSFLVKELQTGYVALFRTLCASGTTVRQASDAVLLQFERPADQSQAVKDRRYGYSQQYYKAYAGTAATTVPATDDKEELTLNVTKQELQKMIADAVAAALDKENPVIKDYKDVPSYFQNEARALLDSEAINGGTSKAVNPNDLNVRLETLKAAIIAVRACDARHSG